MWIIHRNDAVERLYNDEILDEPVSFNENGTANVPSDVGESLIDHYALIEPYSAD